MRLRRRLCGHHRCRCRVRSIRAITDEFQPQSTNPDHEPIRADLRTDDVAIVGVVVGAIIGTRRAAD